MRVGGLELDRFNITKIIGKGSITIGMSLDDVRYPLHYYHSIGAEYYLDVDGESYGYEFPMANMRDTFETDDEYFNNKYIILLLEIREILHPYFDLWCESKWDAHTEERIKKELESNETFIDLMTILDRMLEHKIRCAYSHTYDATTDIESGNGTYHVYLAMSSKDCECRDMTHDDLLEHCRKCIKDNHMNHPYGSISITVFEEPIAISADCHKILMDGNREQLCTLGLNISHQFFNIFNAAESSTKSANH